MTAARYFIILAWMLGQGLGVARAAGESNGATASERNVWPFFVQQIDRAGRVDSWSGAGPFLFKRHDNDGGTIGGVRPLWVQAHNAQGDFRAGFFLYPIFSYTVDETTYKWSFVELIRRTNRRAGAEPPRGQYEPRGEFEVWPFWFSRETGDPEMSYHGLFPIAGTVKNKLGMGRFTWTLFPLYAEIENRGATTTYTPWPFIRVTRGAGLGGGLWPLFTVVNRPGISREIFYLWPLGYDITHQPTPDDPPGSPPKHDFGALPFYSRTTGPGYRGENFLWPFFGYTNRTSPTIYHETRYLWPFLVQGRGDDRYVNRWGPIYTHSIIKGYDKTWYAWPLVRRADWVEKGIQNTKTQVAYFLFWRLEERSVAHPGLPVGTLTHVWPLFSTWDNGAGRRQWQFLSPFEVFFPGNEKIRNAWSPLVTLARHDQRGPGDTRTSLFWDAITWERQTSAEHREFHIGPLFGIIERAGEKRVTIGNGLFGFKRGTTGTGWRTFWLDFPSKPATTTARSR